MGGGVSPQRQRPTLDVQPDDPGVDPNRRKGHQRHNSSLIFSPYGGATGGLKNFALS